MKNFIFALLILVALFGFTLYSAYSVNKFADSAIAFLDTENPNSAYILYKERKNALSLTVSGNEMRLLQESLFRAMEGDKAALKQARAICQELKEKETLFSLW